MLDALTITQRCHANPALCAARTEGDADVVYKSDWPAVTSALLSNPNEPRLKLPSNVDFKGMADLYVDFK